MVSKSDRTEVIPPLKTDKLLSDIPEIEGYKVIGGVVLYEKLGQGGMGAVYRGRHLRLDIDVAIKLLAPAAFGSDDENKAHLYRFLREAKVAAGVTHQNLVRVSDVNSEGDVHYLVMDYVNGESAGDRLERTGALTEAEALKVILGAAEGLAEAHSSGIVHRDIKPDNIMIDHKGRVRVADLGLAKAIDDTGSKLDVTQTNTGIGTPAYMSPEQFSSARNVRASADVWSLGVSLYVLLTNELPWDDESIFTLANMIAKNPLPDPRQFAPDLSDEVIEIMKKATQKNPDDRYPDCAEMAKALKVHLDKIAPDGGPNLLDLRAEVYEHDESDIAPDVKTLTSIKTALTCNVDVSSLPTVATDVNVNVDVENEKSRNEFKVWGTVTLLVAIVVAAIVMFAGSVSPLNLTPEEQAWIKKHPVVRIGVDRGFAPFEYVNDQGEFRGMVYEYLELFTKRTGIKFKLDNSLNWQETLAKAESGDIDVITCFGISERRKKLFRLSKPYLGFPRVFIVRKSSDISNFKQLESKVVGVQESSSHYDILKETTQITPKLYSTFRDCLGKVSCGDIDATVGNMAVANYWMNELSITNLKVGGYVSMDIQKLVMGIRRDWPEFESIANKFLDSVEETERIKIKSHWMNTSGN